MIFGWGRPQQEWNPGWTLENSVNLTINCAPMAVCFLCYSVNLTINCAPMAVCFLCYDKILFKTVIFIWRSVWYNADYLKVLISYWIQHAAHSIYGFNLLFLVKLLQHAHFSNSDFLPCISVLPFFLLYHFLFISENGFCAYQIFTRFCCIKFLCTHSVYHKTIHCSVFNWNLFQLSKIIRHYRGSRLLFWSSGYKMSKFIIDVFFSWILVFISLFVSGFRNGDSVKVWFRFCKH